MGEELAQNDGSVEMDKVENALLKGDLSKLSAEERKDYYRAVCDSVGLNPLTKPFEYIKMNGELTLYAKRDATEQLRKINGVSITDMEKETSDGLIVITAEAEDADGRTDVATGAVSLKGKSGDALANAIMKAETKAKRRVTLSICGLGWIDETEVESIPETETVEVDTETGEIVEQAGKRGELQRPGGNVQNGQPEPDNTDDDDDTDDSNPATDETLSDLRTIAESVAEERGDMDADDVIVKYCNVHGTTPSEVSELVAKDIVDSLSSHYENLVSDKDEDDEASDEDDINDDLPPKEELEGDDSIPF